MAVFREVKLTWKGEDHFVIPSNKLLRRMEREGVYLGEVARKAANGDAIIGTLAFMVWTLLDAAGVSDSEDEVLEELGDMAEARQIAMMTLVFEAFFPKPVTGKKPEGRKQKKRKKSKSKK